MKRRRVEPRDERRKDTVEINLLDENEGGPARGVLLRARRGVRSGILGTTLEALRTGLGKATGRPRP